MSWLSISASDPYDKQYTHQLSVAWENDMFFRRDYYYSNGFRAEFYAPALIKSPLSGILVPWYKAGTGKDYHGLKLSQEIYTPRDLSMDTICTGDQPYVSTLSLEQTKLLIYPDRGLRIRSGIKLGVLGPASLGFITQELAHSMSNPSRPPMGWDYQVKNDIILNYELGAEKNLVPLGQFMAGIRGKGRLGTLHTDVETGIWLAFDRRKGHFRRMGPSGEPGLNLVFRTAILARFVVYDATLQGGMFNRTSPYFIHADEINTWLGLVRSSLLIEYEQHQLDCYARWNSKKFYNAVPHAWMGMAYRYWF
jgi:hypothetical protein